MGLSNWLRIVWLWHVAFLYLILLWHFVDDHQLLSIFVSIDFICLHFCDESMLVSSSPSDISYILSSFQTSEKI